MSKPCNDCPNQSETVESEPGIPAADIPKKPAKGLVIYTGGLPEHHLSMMQHTLPPDYTYGRFLPDGSILYDQRLGDWEPPSLVEGYERDGQDSWSFHPLWESCKLRMYGTEIKENCKCIQVISLCNHPEVKPNDHGEVTYEMCQGCTHRTPIPVPLAPKPQSLPEPFRLPATDQSQTSPLSRM